MTPTSTGSARPLSETLFLDQLLGVTADAFEVARRTNATVFPALVGGLAG